ncbi:MAG: sortase [Candidatus Abawacabacteria bacterium]|nr:sortase [Candidatus Abawacabacteria bacterium]
MYSILTLAIAALTASSGNGDGLVTNMAYQEQSLLNHFVEQMMSYHDTRILALRDETAAFTLEPLYNVSEPLAANTVEIQPTVEVQPTIEPVVVNSGPSISVLPAPVKPTVTPKPIAAATTPKPVVLPRPVTSVPVAPRVIPPAPTPVAIPTPVATSTPAPVPAVPASQPQLVPTQPRTSGPVLAAVNSENIGTYSISIPALGLQNIPVTPTDARIDAKWKDDLKLGVGQLLYPPASGHKTVIFGHSSNFSYVRSNFNEVFKNLNRLVIGNEVFIQFQGQQLKYKVVKQEVVGANTSSIVTDYGREELVLFTCWPYQTSRERYIVYLDRIF